jgi:nucleoside-diphosphate-sugar epimerase
MAKRASEAAGVQKRVFAVSRFGSSGKEEELRSARVETVRTDLLEDDALSTLPDVANVVCMTGQKFGTVGNEPTTWATNAHLPGEIVRKFRKSRIVFFSTGNVYPLVPVGSGGSGESCPVSPVGEYAQSRLGGERILEYFAAKYGTRALIFRLNYALEVRYGVLHDIALAVLNREEVDLSMGYVNVIWQGDANEAALRGLGVCSSPPSCINVTGREAVPIRWLASEFGKAFGVKAKLVGRERRTALLSDSSKARRLLGEPAVSVPQMVSWVAAWVKSGGESLGKPTHFHVRDGRF